MTSAYTSEISLKDAVEFIVDNRGRSAPIVDSGIKLIATNCISNKNLYPTNEQLRYVSSDTYANWFRSHPLPGDIILTNKGSQNGAVCLVPDPVDFCIAQDMVALRADPEKIYPLYLFAALRSRLVQERIKQLNVDAVIPHFKKTDFDKLQIPLPAPPQQKAIGDFYFQICEKIELNQQMNETLEVMARTIFKDWFLIFGPTRAKAEGQEPYLSPVFWGLFPDALDDEDKPAGWKHGSLLDVATLNPESWSKKHHPEEIEYVDLANTKWGTIESTQVYKWADAPSRAQRILRTGYTIVGTVRPGNGSYSFVNQDGLTGSTGFAVLGPKTGEYREFVYLASTSPENIERLAHVADGAAYPAVRPSVVAETEVVLPSDKVITSFSKLVSPLIDRMEANKQENATLAETRDLLLPKLVSGEIRLREAEKAVEAVA
ncbi:MAG: restriction endonuclease subunit S [Candidatus Thiodiazotropha sp.]